MKIKRRKALVIRIGNIRIGGNNAVAIQSMLKTKASDVELAIKQIESLEKSGCEIIRLAVKDSADARAIRKIKARTKLPLVADIHFDWRLAIEAIESGADKIRLNPGNIYKKEEVARIVSALRSAKIPLRIGMNSGSVKDTSFGKMHMPDRLVKCCMQYLRMVEKLRFRDIVISLKASNVQDTVEAYRKIAGLCDYPLHLGVTATGLPFAGAIKTSIALGALLMDGIGDTIRVSLTDKPEEEVNAAKIILESLGLRCFGPEIISCPTCGRCEVDLEKLVGDFESRLSALRYPRSLRPVKVAIMGCVVNGPGEAREADIGVAFGKDEGMLFKKGKPVRKIAFNECADILIKEIGSGGK